MPIPNTSVTLKSNEKVTVTLRDSDAFGNPGALLPAGSIAEWYIGPAGKVSVTPATDTLSAEVQALGPAGVTYVNGNVTIPERGVQPFRCDVTVIMGPVAGVVAVPGTPVTVQ